MKQLEVPKFDDVVRAIERQLSLANVGSAICEVILGHHELVAVSYWGFLISSWAATESAQQLVEKAELDIKLLSVMTNALPNQIKISIGIPPTPPGVMCPQLTYAQKLEDESRHLKIEFTIALPTGEQEERSRAYTQGVLRSFSARKKLFDEVVTELSAYDAAKIRNALRKYRSVMLFLRDFNVEHWPLIYTDQFAQAEDVQD